MSFATDKLIERLTLKKRIMKWRSLSIFLFLALVLMLQYIDLNNLFSGAPLLTKQDTIARIYISGFIDEDHNRDKLINEIKNNNSIKGLIVHINSSGGTLVGGETLYHSLREVSAKKHVVSVMGNVAASGGYMAAIATDYIIAHTGTITGSIGVLLQSFEVTELANKIGVNFRSLKAGEYKDALSPFTKLNSSSREYLQELLNSSYDYFVSLVSQRRSMSIKEIESRAEGKIYTGQQALLLSLVDQIGGEEEAINWLRNNNVTGSIKDFSLKKKDLIPLWNIFSPSKKSSLGIMAVWEGLPSDTNDQVFN